MPVDLYESIYRITAQVTPEPVVLLEQEDWLEGADRLNPQPQVDAVSFVGGGGGTFKRPNVFHTFTYRVWKEHANIPLAAAYRFEHTIALNELAGVDFHIEILNHEGHITLNKATVAGYDSGVIDRFTVFDIAIIGGAMTSTLSPISVLTLPDGSQLGLPDGSVLAI